MKLSAITIEQFRKFHVAIEIAGLQSGLNILHGPNEAGKSTVAQAIRTVFLDRHRAGGAAFQHAVLPEGERSAAPRIAVQFHLGGDSCTLEKQYLVQQRARLRVGSDEFVDADADDRLAALLGFSLTSSGPSRPELQGIPGLLWIEQGSSGELHEQVDRARAGLDERLKDIIGQVSSSLGARVSARVDEQLASLRRGGKRDPGPLARTTQELEESRRTCADLQQRSTDFRQRADALSGQLAALASLDAEKPWQEQQRRLDGLKQQQAALEPQQQALLANSRLLEGIDRQIEDLHRQREVRAAQLAEHVGRTERLPEVERVASEAARRIRVAEQRLASARAGQEKARKEHDAAQAQRTRAELERSLAAARTQEQRIKDKLDALRKVTDALQPLGEQHAAHAIHADDVDRLERTERALHENRIKHEAVVTRLDFRVLANAARIHSDQLGDISGEVSHQLDTAVTLRIEGVGEIDIIPGGGDAARLAAAATQLDADIREQCARLGVSGLAQARAQLDAARERQERMRHLEIQRAAILESQDEHYWQQALASVRGEREQYRRQLGELPEPAPDTAADVAHSQLRLDDARLDAEDAEAQLHELREAVTGARLALQELQTRIEDGEQRLHSDSAREAAVVLERELYKATVRRDQLAAQVTADERLLAQNNPQQIDADIRRYTQALDGSRLRRKQLDDGIREARAQLAVLGGDGLDERLAHAIAERTRLEEHLQQHRQREDALELLHETLRKHQEKSTQRLYAPLRERLMHYLELLFPGMQPHMDIDHLRPAALHRAGRTLAFEQYSHGTREQLGVLARFAYADLLAEAGQPTLLMLDDALVHSDSGRREQMQRILFDAAQRHQVLLFTCHPEHWRDAGPAAMVDIAALQALQSAAPA